MAGADGTRFTVFSRQHVRHPLNFSVGLVHTAAEGHRYRLLRCNGLHPGGYVNHIEGTRFGTSFHVHRATARYQEAGLDADGFAEETGRFTTLDQAIAHLALLANISAPGGEQEVLPL